MLTFLRITILIFIAHALHATEHSTVVNHSLIDKLQSIEREYQIKTGVYALDTNSRRVIAYHANDKFPFQSTCKFIAVSALLANKNEVLKKKILIRPQDVLSWHPITGKYINHYVALETLAEGAVSYSDNTAINMIIHELGGLKSVNQFAHNIGNLSFKIANYEVNLNSDPNKDVDTTTPKDMAFSVKKILLEDQLSATNRHLLLDWMKNNTTGYNRIRAGVPLGWLVADKTGSGHYGVANDIGLVWSPTCRPVVLSIFTVGNRENAKPNDEAIAKITRIIFEEFEQHHPCYQAHG